MEAGIHLPLADLDGSGLSRARLDDAVDAAREAGFRALSANDHLVFSRPWLDGPTALAASVERSGEMQLVTSLALAVLRGPAVLAKAVVALDVLSGGRVVAGIGPGSSAADYDLADVPFDERWRRFDAAAAAFTALVQPDVDDHDGPRLTPSPPRPGGVPVWLGSWGSPAGLRRVARLGDGWLASAYNCTPDDFRRHSAALGEQRAALGRRDEPFPHALVTMWTWITPSRADAGRALAELVAPAVRRSPDELRGRLCIGTAAECVDLLAQYAEAGCERVHFWPLADEPRQVELLAGEVLPQLG